VSGYVIFALCEYVLNEPIGFLFRAQPTLMTREPSAELMDQIFTSSDEEGRARLLKIMQEFLTAEAEKHAALEKGTGFL
jgi:cohesin loading factor subunit SCC2